MSKEFLPKSASEYITLVRGLGALIELGMDYVEVHSSSEEDRARSLQRLTEAVETVSVLRGDSRIFDEGRPNGLVEYQHEMSTIETELKSRLNSL